MQAPDRTVKEEPLDPEWYPSVVEPKEGNYWETVEPSEPTDVYFKEENCSDSSPKPLESTETRKETTKKCFACQAVFDDATALNQHMRSTHQDAEGRFKCTFAGCSWLKDNRSQYRSHIVNHSKTICPICGKLYQQYRLRAHIKQRHKEKKIKCHSCKARFAFNSGLNVHVKRVHGQERPFLCGVCGKSFTVAQSLKLHEMTHTKEQPYKCTDCGRGFNKYWNFIQHKRIHTGELPYACSVCGERFRHNVTMKQHRLKHQSCNSE